jgi:hypothetical protein
LKIKTIQTGGGWIELKKVEDEFDLDPGTTEARRVLSAAVRSQNLVVLTGLGTSLCVTEDGQRLAPTMGDLIDLAQMEFAAKDMEDGAFKDKGGRWSYFKLLAQIDADCKDLELFLSRAKVAVDFLHGDSAAHVADFLELAEDVIRKEVDFLSTETDLPVHDAFLRRIARRSSRRARFKLFTTNYDRCFEQAAQNSGFVVVDGFAFGSEAVFDSAQFNYDVVRRTAGEEKSEFIENLFHLYKLHGSIDWELNPKTQRILKRPGTKSPLLIYPRATKYEMAFSQPYIEMMGAFQTSLRAPSTTMIVVGFGFNDKHLAEPILAAIKGNLSLNLVIVDPAIEERSAKDGNEYVGVMRDLIDHGDGRVALIAAKFEELVEIIPDVAAETELERHNDRVRKIGSADGRKTR